MDADYGRTLRGRDDPLYDEGLAFAQAGEWAAALRCFEELAERYPGDVDVVRALDQARFKARLDKETRVKPAGPRVPWRRLLMLAALVISLAAILYFTLTLMQTRVLPALAAQRQRQAFEALLDGCRKAVEGSDPALARAECDKVLQEDPRNAEVAALLTTVETKEKQQQMCQEAVDLLTAGDYPRALEKLTDIQLIFPNTCDAPARIKQLTERQSLEGLFKQGKEAFEAGNYQAAVDYYEQVRARNTTYEAETVAGHLAIAYVALGRQIVEQDPPALEQLPLALDYFTRSLAFDPKSQTALAEQRLASQFLAGQQALDAGRLDDAIQRMSAAVDARPGYLGGLAAQRLYDAYLTRGDQYRDAGDPSLAYRMYDLAMQVTGVDTASARNRRDSVAGLLTPTPTPTATPTETPVPTPTPYRPPTEPPPPTPAPPLATFRGKIIYRSDKPGQAGLWVMNPDGSQKRPLGASAKLEQEYEALREREAYSPDGRFRAYALRANGDSSVQIYWQGVNSDGYTITTRITDFGKISYDPVWSPDGGRIAFVSAARESDDIWVASSDGKGDPKNLTPNPWEWDKHPSWSPDSKQTVFWSNRDTKRKLIWVMDADGGNPKCLSDNCRMPNPKEELWEEYDPIWIK